MDKKIDIHKAGAILINGRKILVCRQEGWGFFAPGGRLEVGETPEDALKRELKEECSIDIEVADLKKFGTFYAAAAGQENKNLQMDVFVVKQWEGEIRPSGEIVEVRWINSNMPERMSVGSVIEHEVLPRLKKENLID